MIAYKNLLLLLGLPAYFFLTNCCKNVNERPIKTVVMLGNSITFSPRWEGGKGMAASIKDSDYIHLLTRDIHQFDPSVVIKYGNIAEFERDFDTYPLSKLDDSLKYIAKIGNGVETYPLQAGLDSIRNPDMLILKICENVKDEKAMQDDFIKYYDSLIKYLCPDNQAVIIIVDGFWAKKNVNSLIEEYASKEQYPFVTIKDLSKDSTNMAIGKYDLNSPVWLYRQLSLRGQSAESESFTMLSNACSNPDWVKHTTDYLTAIVKHMEENYGNRIKAYTFLGGQTDEWMDYSNGTAGRSKTQAWSNWLKDKGKNSVPVPSYERIDHASFNDLVRDPKEEQDIIDYFHFTGDIIAETVLKFAKITRGIISKDKQIGMFFGYVLELTQSRMVRSGHLEYERLYSSPDIDFFISPGTYSDRQMGGGSGFMVPNGTRILNGKGFLHEIDHRTPTYNVNLDEYVSIGWMKAWNDQAETNAGLKREFSLATINNASLWCFDMWGGVFKTPETMRIVEQSRKIWDQYNKTDSGSLAEVALIVDPQSARLINDLNPIVKEIYQGIRNKLNRLGAPFDVFSFNDLEKADFSQYKLVIFPGLFEVTPEKKDILEKYVFNNSRAVLFMYAPGISNGRDLDITRVKELTDISFNTPGITRVQRNGWVSVYSPNYDTITPKILKRIASEAGVTIYCSDEIPVFANEKLVAVHTADGGEKTITLPIPAKKVKELYTGKTILVYKMQFKYNFLTPDTALFEII